MRRRELRQWLIEFACDGIDPAREAAFRSGLAEHPDLAAEWRELTQVDRLLATLAPPEPSETELTALREALDAGLSPRSPARSRFPGRWLSAGAAATLLVGLVLLRNLPGTSPATAPETFSRALEPAPETAEAVGAPAAPPEPPAEAPARPRTRALKVGEPPPPVSRPPAPVRPATTTVPAPGPRPRLARRSPAAPLAGLTADAPKDLFLAEAEPERMLTAPAPTPTTAPSASGGSEAAAGGRARMAEPVEFVSFTVPEIVVGEAVEFSLRAVDPADLLAVPDTPRPAPGLRVEPAILVGEVAPMAVLTARNEP